MRKPIHKKYLKHAILLACGLSLAAVDPVVAQETSPQMAAPVDLTGTWISVVTEDWRWRMIVPAKGDFASLPLTEEGRRIANTWDPEVDKAKGDECKAYGPGGIMRMPARVKISWEDNNSIRLETDHGRQVRMFHFDSSELNAAGTLQGNSKASWDNRSLKVITRDMSEGYVRRNGVPYSANAVVTEWFDQHTTFGEQWFTVTTVVEDPLYFNQKFVVSSSFKKLANDRSWNPKACVSEWGLVKEGDRFVD